MKPRSTDHGAVPLLNVPTGHTVRLVDVRAGHGLRHRLAAMGLLPNVAVTVLRNEGRGQVIVQVKNTRIVLGRGMAHHVLVRPEPIATGGGKQE